MSDITVEMRVGRFWWWIRTVRRSFTTPQAAFSWVDSQIVKHRWYRYRMSGDVNAGGGNF